jgi:hypothetical protein
VHVFAALAVNSTMFFIKNTFYFTQLLDFSLKLKLHDLLAELRAMACASYE